MLIKNKLSRSARHHLLAFYADAPKHDAAQRGIGIEPAGVSQPLVTSPTHTGARCAAEPGIPLAEKNHAASRATFTSANATGKSLTMHGYGIRLVCAETAVAFCDKCGLFLIDPGLVLKTYTGASSLSAASAPLHDYVPRKADKGDCMQAYKR